MKQKLITALIAFSASISFATTWSEGEVKDPISGKSTKVQKIGSYGGYIYSWPSKYDAVYWPLTDAKFIRFNTESGYIAFGSDFEKLEPNKVGKITEYLKSNYDPNEPPKTHVQQLEWLEKVYTVRGAPPEFYIRHYCLLSYLTRDRKEVSNKYRKQALDKIEVYLKEAEPSAYRSHLYIVAGFYSKLLGDDEKSKKFWSSPERLKFDEKVTEKGKKYLEEILKSIKTGKYKEGYNR